LYLVFYLIKESFQRENQEQEEYMAQQKIVLQGDYMELQEEKDVLEKEEVL